MSLLAFRCDEAGGSAAEFALVGTVFMLLLLGALEFSVFLLVGANLESAALTASRYGVTGFEMSDVTREAKIKEIIADRTFGMVDMDKATITTKVYEHFADIGTSEEYVDANENGDYDVGEDFTDTNGNNQWDEDIGVEGVGGSGDIVVYKIEYPWAAFSGLIEPFLGGAKLSAAVAVMNEPW